MPAFALPIPPRALANPLHRPTERSATTPEDSNQLSVIRTAGMEAREHPGDLPVLAPPALGCILIDVAQIAAVQHPYLHLVGPNRWPWPESGGTRASISVAGQTPRPGWRRSISTPF